jgi:hypothetical protein
MAQQVERLAGKPRRMAGSNPACPFASKFAAGGRGRGVKSACFLAPSITARCNLIQVHPWQTNTSLK